MVVVSALNVIHEYFQYKQQESDNLQAINAYVQRLHSKIDLALIRIKS
jgi:cell division protein ZapA